MTLVLFYLSVCLTVCLSNICVCLRVMDVSRGVSLGRGMEKRRELVRSQTLPRNIGAQVRRPFFEKLDSEADR